MNVSFKMLGVSAMMEELLLCLAPALALLQI